MKHRLFLLGALATLAAASAGRASILTTGNFQTGTPTPTLSLSTPVTLAITASDNVSGLVFDEWVTNDGTQNTAFTSPRPQTLSYQIDGGAVQTVGVGYLVDNLAGTVGDVTANDGYLVLNGFLFVTAGQTLTFLPGSLTFGSGGAAFNPPPVVFNGNAYVDNMTGNALSGPASVNVAPEPSAWALLGVGVGALGLSLRRRRAVR